MANSLHPKINLEEIFPSSCEETRSIEFENGFEEEIGKCIESEYEHVIKKPREGFKKYIGLLAAFVAGFLISVSILAVKMLTKYHPFTVSLWRYAGNIPLLCPLLGFYYFRKRNKLFQNVFPLTTGKSCQWITITILLGNGILAWACVNLRFYSLQYLTLADTSVIAYSSPVFVVIFAHFWLKERCGVVSVILSVVAVIGVIVIARPPLLTGNDGFDTQILIGTSLAFGSMLAHTCICILIRKSRKVHYSLVIFIHGISGILLSFVAMESAGLEILRFPEGKTDIIFATIVVVSGFGTQLFLTLAFKFEEAAPVSLILCLEVILTYLWQYIFLDTIPDLFSLIGSTIIMAAVSLAIFRKWLFSLPESNSGRKHCCLLLQ